MTAFGIGGGDATATIPDTSRLAALVSGVTKMVCGTTFTPIEGVRGEASICAHMVVLPLKGLRDINLVLSSDIAGAQALGAAICGSSPEQMTKEMVDDAFGELLNMVAGRIKSALEIDQALGLPKATSLTELTETYGVGIDDVLLLTGKDLADLGMWIFESMPSAAPSPAGTRGRICRSLFRAAKPRPCP